MKIIFVRHGTSVGNERGVHQTPEERLSKEGLRQAEIVANRLKTAGAGLIISSRCTRAMQTAGAISKATGTRVVYTNLFNEALSPSEVHGKRYDGNFAAPISRKIEAHAADPKWHYSDEENLFDVRKRALKALEYLESKKEDTLIVVTHSAILRMIMFVGIFGEDARVSFFYRFRDRLDLNNTAITECEVGKRGFRLITYNDHAHLK